MPFEEIRYHSYKNLWQIFKPYLIGYLDISQHARGGSVANAAATVWYGGTNG